MARTQIPAYESGQIITATHANTYWKNNEQAHWERLTSIYVGKVGPGSTVIRLPAGWTCVNVTDGAYEITHNLGDTNYVIVGAAGYSGRMVSYDSVTTTRVILRCYGFDGSADNAREISFILVHYGAW
jgi:hypothetical protein